MVYYRQPPLHPVHALTDSGESVAERYRYDPYGKATVLDADHSADADGASDLRNPYLYTGRRLDKESLLMQYRPRYYSWKLGRFISRDPKGYVDGLNLYEYAVGNPAGRIDHWGGGPE